MDTELVERVKLADLLISELPAKRTVRQTTRYTFNPSVLRVSQWNPNSLAKEGAIAEMLSLVAKDAADVICISECRAVSQPQLNMITSAGFCHVKLLRTGMGGGSMLLWRDARFSGRDISGDLPLVYRNAGGSAWESFGYEVAAAELTPRVGGEPLRVASLYLRPPGNGHVLPCAELDDHLREMTAALKPDIVVGDFNARTPEWEVNIHGNANDGSAVSRGRRLVAMAEDMDFFFSVPPSPTCRTGRALGNGSGGSVIDLAFLRQNLLVESVTVRSTTSEHGFVTHRVHLHDTPLIDRAGSRPKPAPSVAPVAWESVTDADRCRAVSVGLTRLNARAPESLRARWQWLKDALHRTMDALPRVRQQCSLTVPKSVHDAGEAVEEAVAAWLQSRGNDSPMGDESLLEVVRKLRAAYVDECKDFSRRLLEIDARSARVEDTMAWRIYQRFVQPARSTCSISHQGEKWSTDQEIADGMLGVFAEKHARKPGVSDPPTSVSGVPQERLARFPRRRRAAAAHDVRPRRRRQRPALCARRG